jgi:peptide/nickel transport system permease protein
MAVPEPLGDLLKRPPRPKVPFRFPIGILIAIALLTLLAPVLALHDPRDALAGAALQPPSVTYPLGTDALGRDVYSRTLWGGRQTLSMALLATAITILPGMPVGIIAGYYGGGLDRLLMAAMDMLLAFPSLLLALALIALIGPGPAQVALAVGIAGLPAYARVARAAVLQVRSQLYVEAARAVGARSSHVLVFHVLPNILETLLSFAAVSLSWSLLNGAALAFLGFSGDPSAPDWGTMLSQGRDAFRVAPWIAIPPGIAITLTVFAVNRLADAWQDSTANH